MSTQVVPRRISEIRPKLAIERVEVFGVAVPLVGGGFKNAYVTKTVQKSAIVRVTAASGAVGLGNIDPSPGYSTETIEESLAALRGQLAPGAIGVDAANIHVLNARLDKATPGFLDSKAAIEMACVDLTARALGVPVHAYLGGAVKERLSFNAWIGITMALRIDANAGYDADTAIRLAHLVQPYNLQLFEQPVPSHDLAGMARVRREAGGVPIMADESILDHASLIAVIKAGAADIVKLKVMKQGGFHRAAAMLATAEAAGLRCVIGHGFGLGVNTMAEIMLAATSANVIDGLECVGPLKTVDDITTEKLDLGAGVLALPPGPGLGVALDEAKLARYRLV